MPETDVYDQIIWSADVDNDLALLDVVRATPKLKKIKIDRLYVRRNGDSIFDKLKDFGKDVFNDAKLV